MIRSGELFLWTSPTAVEISFHWWREKGLDFRIFYGKRIVAIGEGTRDALRRWGISPDFVGEGKRGLEDLLPLLHTLPPSSLWVFQNAEGRWEDLLPLSKKGFTLHRVPTHRMVPRPSYPEALRHALKNQWLSGAVFTSPSQVSLAITEETISYFSQIPIFAFGEPTQNALSRYPSLKIFTPPRSSLKDLLHCVQEVFSQGVKISPS